MLLLCAAVVLFASLNTLATLLERPPVDNSSADIQRMLGKSLVLSASLLLVSIDP